MDRKTANFIYGCRPPARQRVQLRYSMAHQPATFMHSEREPTPILLISRGLFHPHLFARQALENSLRATAGCRVQVVNSLGKLEAEVLHDSRAVVLYIHEKRITPEALARLDAYVRSGGGLLAVHAAAASFKDSQPYFELLGGRFVAHGAVEQITIRPLAASTAIFGRQAGFSVRDELYRMETRPDITVHFLAEQGESSEPFVWTRRHGQGRVCYLAAGHTLDSLRQPAIVTILQRGLSWCAGHQLQPDGQDA